MCRICELIEDISETTEHMQFLTKRYQRECVANRMNRAADTKKDIRELLEQFFTQTEESVSAARQMSEMHKERKLDS
jgi:ERCC4-type nuclease